MSGWGRGPTIFDLTRAVNVMDFGADPTGNADNNIPFTQAIYWLTNQQVLNGGVILIPVGTFALGAGPQFVRARSHLIEVPSGIMFVGQGRDSVIQLRPTNINKTIFRNSDPSGGNDNIGFMNLRLDGNRTNNTSGSWQGIDMFNVTDLVIEGVEVHDFRGDGIAIDHCERHVVRDNELHDNGRHGLFMHFSHRGVVNSNRSYSNSVVEAAGTGDGINLSMRSQDNMVALNLCYDESAFGGDPPDQVGTGKRQAYGVREADNEMVDRNALVANYGFENLSGIFNQDWGRSINFGIDRTILGHNNQGNA